ncbi:MAG: hypothetical protein A3E87_03835 [Gammaproteobacteria bacterium RIFCSPHIGHO2_12_FULL_35_23]|nr:MAG: hypothetical protein A3E87_03835 [Gammaproteobacteria bacterium RIFCSPHIGHO2_12_FULL_35_23]
MNQNNYFTNKIVWITGASSGIGYALTKELYQRGATLVISGRNETALQKLANEMTSDRVFIQTLDVTDLEANKQVVDNILKKFHKLDIVILNAGISQHAKLANFTQGFAETINVNVLGVVNGIGPVLNYFLAQKQGHLAVVCSLSGFGGLPGAEAYSSSKAAVRSMLQGLTAVLIKTKITVSTICPGFIKTPLTDKNQFYMPFLMTADKAAKIIADGLAKRKILICFPWLFSWLVRFLNILPNSLYVRLIGLYKR